MKRRQPGDRDRKRRRAEDRFPFEVRAELLKRLSAGEAFGAVCAELEVPQQRVHGWSAWGSEWAAALDAALMAGRDPDLPHGTAGGYRAGCRCPDCRSTKTA